MVRFSGAYNVRRRDCRRSLHAVPPRVSNIPNVASLSVLVLQTLWGLAASLHWRARKRQRQFVFHQWVQKAPPKTNLSSLSETPLVSSNYWLLSQL